MRAEVYLANPGATVEAPMSPERMMSHPMTKAARMTMTRAAHQTVMESWSLEETESRAFARFLLPMEENWPALIPCTPFTAFSM